MSDPRGKEDEISDRLITDRMSLLFFPVDVLSPNQRNAPWHFSVPCEMSLLFPFIFPFDLPSLIQWKNKLIVSC